MKNVYSLMKGIGGAEVNVVTEEELHFDSSTLYSVDESLGEVLKPLYKPKLP